VNVDAAVSMFPIVAVQLEPSGNESPVIMKASLEAPPPTGRFPAGQVAETLPEKSSGATLADVAVTSS
jgi:hypothetical protein